MKDKWRRMTTNELRAAMAEARQKMERASAQISPAAPIAFHEAETSADEIASELSRRQITLYTAVAAIAGMVAAVASLVAVFK